MTFRGRVALVTGAGSGLGRLAARRLAAAGATVAAWDLDAAALDATAEHAARVHPMVVDVTDADAVTDAVARVEAEHGPVDRLMAAAGICRPASLVEQPLADIEQTMLVNYFGTVRVTKAVLGSMVARGTGDVVHFASLAGWLPTPRLGAYDASKFAVVAFTEVLAHEVRGSGLRVTAVCPPPVRTPMLDGIKDADPMAVGIDGIEPEVVLDAVEAALEAGEVFAFPGRGTSVAVRLRRLAPGVVWRRIERALPS